MNLVIMIIVFLIGTVIIDFLTIKYDDFERSARKETRQLFHYVSQIVTYLLFTFVFALFMKNFLVPKEYFTCNNQCNILISNTIVGVITMLFQILNIAAFYDMYVYAYRYFTKRSSLINKLIVSILGLITVIFNEFLLKHINLAILTFDNNTLNIITRIIINSLFIFLPLTIIIYEVRRFICNMNKDEFE